MPFLLDGMGVLQKLAEEGQPLYPHVRFSVSSQLLHRANSCGRYMLLMKANTMLDMPLTYTFDASPNGAAMSETEKVHFP
jgi:hypothetical protein